ncbi:MAG: phosphomannomutase/phosphoglucomutase [Chlorobi bacterium]|nr:phosphomannomutase/phosphoglucomutase [Chlorobiota bacterium]
MKAFHAYDIRGIYNKDFNKEDVYKIGYYLPELIKADKVLIGRDVRKSSPEIFEYLCKGITDSGADVFDAGLATTPMVYWATAKFGFDASIMITASHNPKEYNGLKVSKTDALPVGYDTGLGELEEKVLKSQRISPNQNKGKIKAIDVKNDYLKFLETYNGDFSNLNIAMDCSNGVAGLLIEDILHQQPNYINLEPDGTFPNHEPNPLIPKNVEQLQKLVALKKSDIGVIYDGDADRVMFVDENSRFIPPDLIIALLGHYFLEKKGLKGKVLQDIRSSKSVTEYVSKMGSTVEMWKVGRAYAALKLREIDGIYGGELAGHYYFRDFYYSDSGIMASLIVLQIVSRFKKEGLSFSALIDRIKNYENSGEINYKIEKKKEAMEAVKDFFTKEEKPLAFFDFDGYRVEFEKWWFNIRPSNTEPYLRLLVEATNEKLLQEKLHKIESILETYK